MNKSKGIERSSLLIVKTIPLLLQPWYRCYMTSMTLILSSIILLLVAAMFWIITRSTTKKKSNSYSSPSEKQIKKHTSATQKSKQAQIPGPILSNIDTYSSGKNSFQADIETSCSLFLDLLYHTLDLNSVTLLKGDPENKKVFLHTIITGGMDILDKTSSLESGIFNVLFQGNTEVNVCPVSQQVANIPYYSSNKGVGSLLAIRVPDHNALQGAQEPFWILSIDRLSRQEWTGEEQKLLRLAARKISRDLYLGNQLLEAARYTNVVSRLYNSIKGLNSVLELEETFDIAITSVKDLVVADFVSISLLKENEYTVVRAEGYQAEGLEGCKFAKNDGLVGQAIQCNHWMPPMASYPDPAPVFSKENPISGLKSLLIVPLSQQENNAIGALTIASKKEGMFGREQRHLMELIGSQIATKIELAQAHEKIYQMALTDGLTGLNNHRTFQLGLDNMLIRARRQSSSICLILCDIDHFKKINDMYGHPFGDQVLKKVAEILKLSIRKVDLAARYGGEEFALILEASDEEGAIIQSERVRHSIEELRFSSKGEKISITMSFGLASYPVDGDNKAELIDRADQALYCAKESGRNRTVAWSEAH
jgi:two-component system, cell cycle response regulator